MELKDYLHILRRRWLSIILVTLASVSVSAAITMSMTPQYTATTRLFFAVQGGESVTDLAQGSSYATNQMTSYAEVATSPLVLSSVITELQLDISLVELSQSVTAVVPPKTVILEIAASNSDADKARTIADAVGRRLARVAAELSPEPQGGDESVRATILAPAIAPVAPSSPSIVRNLLFAAVLGSLSGLALAGVRQALDTKVRSEQDVESVTKSAVLGFVPFDPDAPSNPVVMHNSPLSARSEAVRRLRTNLQFVELANEGRSLLVTSSIPGEGKSTTSINLAVSLADTGVKTILIDADLRRPAIADYLGIEGSVGLTTLLIGRAELADVTQCWQETTLDILPAGQIPPNPSELLGSKAMSALLDRLSTSYDMIVLDTSPLLPVTDAAILSKLVDGTLVVVGADRIHKQQLRNALESLMTVSANVLGIVLNKVDRQNVENYVYHSEYSLSKGESNKARRANVSNSNAAFSSLPASDPEPVRPSLDVA